MTIASALTALNTDIQNARTAITNKGGTVTSGGGSSQLATDIATIPSGGTIDSLTVTPTTSQQTITALGGVDGYSPITVNAVTASIDSNISAGNIKKDVQILGVTGTYEGGGGIGIPREVSQQGVYQPPASSFTFSLPPNTTDLSDYVLSYAFYKSGITSIDLSSLITLTGNYSLQYICNECPNLTNVDLSNLKTINTRTFSYTFKSAFSFCPNLTNVDLSNLETITTSYMMGGYIFDNCFANCTSLSSFIFNKLKTITCNYALNRMFSLCKNLTTVRFPLLDVIQKTPSGFTNNGFCLCRTFQGCYKLSDIYFNSLKTTSFGSYTNQFKEMLYETGTTVTHTLHFPSNLETTIQGLSDYPLFGGTSGYVVLAFDLPATS